MTDPAGPQRRHALLIGIDAYPRLTPLRGCTNDVLLMRAVLEESFGFPPSNIVQLLNEQATRAGILAAFDALIDRVGAADIVAIHFAGHGSLMTDREGDEPDGFDSTIMPFDSEGWQGDNRDITDDEIHAFLLRLAGKTRHSTLIFDCCHSGTITRDSFGEQARSQPPDRRPAAELPPSPVRSPVTTARSAGPSGWLPLSDSYVLIAGCSDDEKSYEYSPPEGAGSLTHGALSYFLCQELRRAAAGMSWRDVFERVSASVSANHPRQHPQMEGRADRELFGARDLAPMSFVRVSDRLGDRVLLAAGAAHGVSAGSLWTVYPQGTRQQEEAEPAGEVEIVRVRATRSEARIRSETRPIGPDDRAVETTHSWGDLRLGVGIVADRGLEPDAARLAAAIQVSPLLVDAGTGGAARVYLLAPRQTVQPGDPVPQLGPLAAPTMAAVRADGELLMPPCAPARQAEVVVNLEKLARFRQALALDNPAADSTLRGRFTLELLRLAAGEWQRAEPDPACGHIVYHEGERIAFRIASMHTEPVFVSLLDFGLSGGVSLIFPEAGAREKLRAGGWFEVGTRDELVLGFPAAFPFTPNRIADTPAEALETVKLFITTAEADFGFLLQEGVRSPLPAAAESPLLQLWRAALLGPSTRDIVRTPVRQDDWTTVVKPFMLRRRSIA